MISSSLTGVRNINKVYQVYKVCTLSPFPSREPKGKFNKVTKLQLPRKFSSIYLFFKYGLFQTFS